jgi:hypothetical protein
MELQPMNAADRRIVHKEAGDAGLITESVGEGRDRHIILKPSEDMKTATKTSKASKDEAEVEADDEE